MARRPQRTNRRFSLTQARRRLKALARELTAIGGAWDQSAGEVRRRVLGLLETVKELIDRFPTSPE